MAQMFNTVSPTLHEELSIVPEHTLMKKCGLVYYGCCEPLHDRIGMLKRYGVDAYYGQHN